MDDLRNFTTTDVLLPPILDTDACMADLPRLLEPWDEAAAAPVVDCLSRARACYRCRRTGQRLRRMQ